MEAKISYLGIDVGGTKVALRVVDGPRCADTERTWDTFHDVAADMATVAAATDELLRDWPAPVTAVGVAMPATMDQAGRVTAWPNRPGWTGANPGALLGEIFPGAPVRLADDGDLAAVAEADAAGCADLVYFGVGTGIGGGIVSDGRPWPGPAKGSCELGHLIVDRSGPDCRCGRRGCVQAVASGPATLNRAAELLGRAPSFAELVAAYGEAADWAVAAVDEGAAALAAAVVGVSELAHPSLVLVGGGFAAALPGYVEEVARQVATLTTAGRPRVPVKPAALGARSSLAGAVLLAANPDWHNHPATPITNHT